MDGEGPAVAHNGVRGDDVVEVREASDEESPYPTRRTA